VNNPFNIDIVRQKLAQTKRALPIVMAKQAENYFTASFTKGQLGEFKWKEVQRRIPGTYAYKYPKKKGLTRRRKPILVGTGALRRKVSNSIRDADWNKVRLLVDLPYANVHNEGEGNMPPRPFMKQTNELTKLQIKKINQTLDKIWQGQYRNAISI
jgi:phage gpG-like protein